MNLEQARKLAQAETTAPEIFAELAKNKDYKTCKANSANPNK